MKIPDIPQAFCFSSMPNHTKVPPPVWICLWIPSAVNSLLAGLPKGIWLARVGKKVKWTYIRTQPIWSDLENCFMVTQADQWTLGLSFLLWTQDLWTSRPWPADCGRRSCLEGNAVVKPIWRSSVWDHQKHAVKPCSWGASCSCFSVTNNIARMITKTVNDHPGCRMFSELVSYKPG